MKDNSGPAFPGEPDSVTEFDGMQRFETFTPNNGLTKREYFAGQAMMAIVGRDDGPAPDWVKCSQHAVDIADALLAELAKEE